MLYLKREKSSICDFIIVIKLHTVYLWCLYTLFVVISFDKVKPDLSNIRNYSLYSLNLNFGWIRLYACGLDSGPNIYSFIGGEKIIHRCLLLLLVKAHNCLNIHTTLSGPSANVSGKINVFINLPDYLQYLVSCVFCPPLSLVFLNV